MVAEFWLRIYPLALLLLSSSSWWAWSGAGGESVAVSRTWLELGQFHIDLGFLFDGVAATMLLMVAFVGFLIHVFSPATCRQTRRAPASSEDSIFMFSMLGIVLMDNLIMIFIFWELVGFSSYMLIGHYGNRGCQRSVEKGLSTGQEDVGFLIGIVYAYWQFGTTHLSEMSAIAGLHPEMLNWLIPARLMCGFIGKSLQFPLHVWLPDAMAGLTLVVSALIHARWFAAGVYFHSHCFPLYSGCAHFIAWLKFRLPSMRAFVPMRKMT